MPTKSWSSRAQLRTGKTGKIDARENKHRENLAATKIQRLFRGIQCRTVITKQSYAVNEIQRCFRGHRGRKEFRRRRRARQDWKHMSFLHYMVLQLQRCFRGYYSRKYKQDHARRKQYCRMIEEKGRLVLEGMERYLMEQTEMLAEEAKEKRDKEFKSLAQNLHHLMSTQHIRGVFNPIPQYVMQPTMNQLPVEEHIRGVVKDLLRTRGYTKRGMEPDINGTLKIPLKGLKHRLSLQASAPYDAVQQAERRDKHLHKIITADKGKDFLAGGKTAVIDNKEAPLAVGEPYLDPWANPMLVKGVPENQKQLLESARTHKALFAPPVAKPFVSRVGGNRSSALPNDVFDVIAEAEETGGAIHRHLGTRTLRFGLPASADARYDVVEDPKASETVIPKAPMRTSSTMRSTTRRIRNYSDTGKHLGPKVATSGKINYQDIVFENDQDEEFNANTLHVDSSDEEDA
eukprot:gene690-487_t